MTAAKRLVCDLGAGVKITDFANLIEGVSVEPAGTFKAEYGVADAPELADRLANPIGRLSGREHLGLREALSLRPDEADITDVSLFLDISWVLADDADVSVPEVHLETAIEGVEQASFRLLDRLWDSFFSVGSEVSS